MKERAQLAAECSVDEATHEATWCQDAQSSVHEATGNKIRICGSSQRWWNAEMNERRRTVGRKSKGRRNQLEASQPKAELQKLIWQSKRIMWSDYLQTLRAVEVW